MFQSKEVYVWTPDFSVGVDEIDSQHRELIGKIETLRAFMVEGRGKEEILVTFDFLEKYIINHFELEEDYISSLLFEHASTHVREHDRIRGKMAEFESRFMKEGVSSSFTLLVASMIFEWFREHIKKTDMELGSFLKERFAGFSAQVDPVTRGSSELAPKAVNDRES